MSGTESAHGTEKKRRGNKLGFWFFMVSLRLFGLLGTYGLLYIVCPYYVLFDRSAVSSIFPYIDRRFPEAGFFKRRLHALRVFVNQGKNLIDRYMAVLGDDGFDIKITGYDEFVDLIRGSPRGAILLTSHVGNWQVALTALKEIKRTVYLVMRPEENPAVQESLQVDRQTDQIKIISPDQYLGGVVEIMNALKKGYIVSMMGDRKYGAKGTKVSFMGQNAWFPYSAFAIAAAVKCPIVVLLSAKVSPRQYSVDLSNIFYPYYESRRNKARQVQPWVRKYVALIETFVDKYPYQFYIFHDVWQEPNALTGSAYEA